MKLNDIENILKARRFEAYKLFKSNMVGSRNLQPSVIQNIENGYNYNFSTLLKYVTALNLKLFANDIYIKEPKDLGRSIKKYRQENKLTQLQVMMQCDFQQSKMGRMEKGTCSRNSLETLMIHYPDFKLEIKETYE